MNKKVISIVAIVCLVAILGICLVACNADSYVKKLEKAGYMVTKLDGEDAKEEMGAEGIKWMVMGIKMDFMSPDSVIVICFDKADDAKAFAEAMEGEDETEHVEVSGKIVFIGTEQGVKDAK
jgi:hypothetical protein